MNYRMVLYFLGVTLRLEGLLMLLPVCCDLIYRENYWWSFAIIIVLLLILGTVLTRFAPENKNIGASEGLVTVGLSWILLSLFGSLPFFISGAIPNFVDCFFETVSGFTTTGATIVPDVEILPRSILLWRSFTHWIGGMGVLVFVLAVLPQSDIKSSRMMHVMRAEVPGPKVGKIVAKISRSARITYGIYIGLTLLEFVLLMCGNMPIYDSLLNSFATAGTGGFGLLREGIGQYGNVYAEYVIAVFMILFGINFNVFYFIIVGHVVSALKSEELRVYLGIIAVATAIITVNISQLYGTFESSFRHALFQVAAIISTTGFATADFNLWPELSQIVLLILMFVGGCVGSTGGGLKVGRIILLVKNGFNEIRYILRPHTVVSVKTEGKAVDRDTIRSTTSYLVVYLMILITSTLIISMIDRFDLITTITTVITCFNNVGPGLGAVGPMGNFAGFNPVSKIILSFIMLGGRLEIFPLLMLFSPSTWRKN